LRFEAKELKAKRWKLRRPEGGRENDTDEGRGTRDEGRRKTEVGGRKSEVQKVRR
jgi:hypothetical protein